MLIDMIAIPYALPTAPGFSRIKSCAT